MKKSAGTINITPTWRGVLPILLEVFENGTPEGRKMALEEMQRLAKIADDLNAQDGDIVSENAQAERIRAALLAYATETSGAPQCERHVLAESIAKHYADDAILDLARVIAAA